ncbi:MAG: hypothetical protein PHG99_01485 [Erysipelotrichaceae bacterium]|jgi:hypothetical protein|nr:hypothetical protein [Erysipelotrichaceae bacterium]MDD4642162.1 hypothetical protein [Erysipelotrichaceae bacterium]
MNKIVLKIFITLLLLLTLIFIIVFNISYFFGTPTLLDKVFDQQVIDIMEEKSQKSGCNLISRFADDKIYYVALCDDEYVYFDKVGNLMAVRAIDTLDLEQLLSIYVISYDLNDPSVKLGYYHDTPVYVLEDDKFELIINYDDMSLMRNYQRS